MKYRVFSCGAIVLLLAVLAAQAVATTLTLDTAKALQLQQSGSGMFTFSATNDAGTITENFLGWTIGFQIRPSGVTTGSLTVGVLTASVVNPMPVGSLEFTQPSLFTFANSGTINGSTQFYSMSLNSTDTLGTLAGLTSYNLGNLGLTASANAEGTWNVYVVQQADPFAKTYWTDAAPADVQFGNLPQSGGNSSILVGTVTVAAVPEPSTLSLAGVALMALGRISRRWLRRSG